VDRERYNSEPPIVGNKSVWFLNGDLVRKHHISKSNGIISLYNINKDRIESCFVSDFKKNREKAYTVKETAELVNRHRKYLPRLMQSGKIPYPIGATKDGKTAFRIRSYYSESMVHEIRDILATFHKGRPRKDGLITNDMTPTKQELTRRMGDGILTYMRTANGDFVPTWTESI